MFNEKYLIQINQEKVIDGGEREGAGGGGGRGGELRLIVNLLKTLRK